MRRLCFCSLLMLAGLLLWPALALATGSDLVVNCDNAKAKLPTVNAALKLLDPGAVNTLRISGTCHESITIDAFRHLTLVGNPTANIISSTTDTAAAIYITSGSNVVFQDLVVEGGAVAAIWCHISLCQFARVTARNSYGAGIDVLRATALLDDITLTGNVYGLVGRAATIRVLGGTFEDNLGFGILLDTGTSLVLALNISVRNNGTDRTDGAAWPGIQCDINSTVSLVNDGAAYTKVISGNSGAGINLTGGSMANVLQTSITGNGGPEVNVANHSMAKIGGGSTITAVNGNAIDLGDLSLVGFSGGAATSVNGFVSCGGQFSAIRGYGGLSGTPNTNCQH